MYKIKIEENISEKYFSRHAHDTCEWKLSLFILQLRVNFVKY